MSKSNFMTGATTVLLLLAIVYLVSSKPNFNLFSAPTQNPAAEEINRQPHTASLRHFSLADMVTNADRIFRGTVISFDPATVTAGGGELPAVTYRIRVENTFKGNFSVKGDVTYAEITMLGNIKEVPAQGSLQRLPVLPTPPRLNVGSDYLLFLTAESSIGLTAPVGLGQGTFSIYLQDKEEWARNEFNNAGLFDGPVSYDQLAAQIQNGGQ